MKCPFCGHADSKVIDSRPGVTGDVTRRRRECEACARRFTTYERVEDVLPAVVKKDGRRENFDRQKLIGGLRRATEKRPVSLESLNAAVDGIERQMLESADPREVSSHQIGEWVMHRLREIDVVAYVRFASVYRSFRDIEEFRAELESLGEGSR